MHVNRVLRSDQRVHELVIYDFLARTYESREARGAADSGEKARVRESPRVGPVARAD
jgi:hypothetical protein